MIAKEGRRGSQTRDKWRGVGMGGREQKADERQFCETTVFARQGLSRHGWPGCVLIGCRPLLTAACQLPLHQKTRT